MSVNAGAEEKCRKDAQAQGFANVAKLFFELVEKNRLDLAAQLMFEPLDLHNNVAEPLSFKEFFPKRAVQVRHHFKPWKVCTYGGDEATGSHFDQIMTDAEYMDTVDIFEHEGDSGYVFRGETAVFYVLYHFHYSDEGLLKGDPIGFAPPYVQRVR